MITFKPVSKDSIGGKKYENRHKKIVSGIIEEFIDSNHEAIELFYEPGDYANANNFRKTFQDALSKLNVKSVHVTIRGSRVFLVKKDGLT